MNEIGTKGHYEGETVINGEKYFYKRNDGFIESIVERIAEMFDIRCVHYENKTINNEDYYLSKDLNSKGKFISASSLGLESHSLSEIEEFIAAYYPKDCENLNRELMTVYFMDLIIMNVDRRNSKWGFLTNEDGVHICILGNESSFVEGRSVMTSMKENPTGNSLFEIGNIIESFSKEDVILFEQMFSTLNCEKLREIVEVVEDEQKRKIKLKNDFFGKFDMHHFRIRRLFEEKDKSLVYNSNR